MKQSLPAQANEFEPDGRTEANVVISKTKLSTQAMTLILLMGSVAFSAQPGAGAPSSTGAAPPSAAGMSVNPSTVQAAAQAIAAPAVTAANASTAANNAAAGNGGPVVVTGPSDVAAPAAAFQDASRAMPVPAGQQSFAPPDANKPKPGATPFVPSVVVSGEAPKEAPHTKAVLHTTMGDITLRMFKAEAPHTVQNFIDLAKGERDFLDPKTSKKVHRPFYTGLIFFRVIKDFVIQTGCPFGTGRGDPGYNIQDEISPNLKFDRPGLVGMALARDKKSGYEKNTNGSQFFITLAPQPAFNGKFTLFAEIVGGMDVAQRIAHVRTGPTDRPIKKVYLLSIDVDEPGPALMQTNNNMPTGVNMALPIPPPTQEPPPVNQALMQQPAAPVQAMPPAIPSMPPVNMPMPASTGVNGAQPGMNSANAMQADPQHQMPPHIPPPGGPAGPGATNPNQNR